MPTCPKCLHNFHRGAESLCPHCGFSLENLDKKYGRDSIPYRRVCDNAGALRQQDRVKLNALLEKLERRIPPVLLSVYFPNILEPFSLIPHSFWMMNHLMVDEAGFPNHQGPLDPQWLLVLVLDVRTDTACFMWGYATGSLCRTGPDQQVHNESPHSPPGKHASARRGLHHEGRRPPCGPEGAFQGQTSHEVRSYAALSGRKERRRCGMKKLLPATMLFMAVLTAPAQELPLLKWSSKDQQSLMKGTWWESHAPILPPVEAAVSPVPSAPEAPADADSPAVDPIPEDFTDVNEYSCRNISGPRQG